MLRGYPLYCDSAIISNAQSSSDVVVVLGTQDTNELGSFAIRAQHSLVQPISLSPPLHLSSPIDCAESLKFHCIPVEDDLEQRLSYPLAGVSLIPHSNLGYSVFQLNSLGDLFYQDYLKVASSIEKSPQERRVIISSIEKSHQVSLGCVLTTPDKILPHLSEFMPVSSEEKDLPEHSFNVLNVDLTEVFGSMNDIPVVCKICNPDLNSTITNEANNSNYKCFSCGYSNFESEDICDSIDNLSLIIGPKKEPSISEFFDVAQFYEFNDKYSKRILDVWDIEENKVEIKPNYKTSIHDYDSDASFNTLTPSSSYPSFNTLTPSSSYPSPSSSTSSLSMMHTQSTPMQSTSDDDVMKQLFNNISSLNSSLNDFSSYQESFDEFVPPSQDIRPVIGETLRKPKKPRTRGSFSLKAGF